jgi:hypothetical protein
MATKTFPFVASTPWQIEVAKTTAYQVLNTDSGTLFTNTGAGGSVTFTLPSLVNGVGCCFWFLATVAQNLVIAAPSGKLISDGSATNSNATFSTSSHIIGSMAFVCMNIAGTFYQFQNLGDTVCTMS